MQRNANNPARGVVIVETALILLTFFFIVLGLMESARFISVQQTLTDAAREGARRAVTPFSGTSTLPNDTEVEAVVRRFLDTNGLQGAAVTIARNVPGTLGGDDRYTQVTASMPYQVLTVALFTDFQVTLTGSSKMRNETSP